MQGGARTVVKAYLYGTPSTARSDDEAAGETWILSAAVAQLVERVHGKEVVYPEN
jgi:hypothetical protein